MTRWPFLLIAIVPLIAQAAQKDQFDLKCSGTSSGYANGSKTSQPFVRIYHVDLVRSEYCVDACERIGRMQEVNSLKIVFSDVKRDAGLSLFRDRAEVERTTGKFTLAYLNSDKLVYNTVEGSCVAAPFTPFPVTKF